jgi:hypothetical protein
MRHFAPSGGVDASLISTYGIRCITLRNVLAPDAREAALHLLRFNGKRRTSGTPRDERGLKPMQPATNQLE